MQTAADRSSVYYYQSKINAGRANYVGPRIHTDGKCTCGLESVFHPWATDSHGWEMHLWH
jgi:hypothetical protein